MKTRVFIFSLIIFCLIFANSVSVNVKANSIEEDPLVPGWSKDVRLTNASGYSAHQEIAIDSKNNIHLSWIDERGDGARWIYYKRSEDFGKTWSNDTEIVEGYTTSIGVDDEKIFVAYTKYISSEEGCEIYYARSIDGGLNWETDLRLTNAKGISSQPRIVIRDGIIYLVWMDNRDWGASWNSPHEIYFAKSMDWGNTWTGDKRITNTSTPSGMASLAVDSNNIIHAVYQEESEDGYKVCYSKSEDGGETWHVRELPGGFAMPYREPRIAIDSKDNLHVVWTTTLTHSSDVFYVNSTDHGETWSDPAKITMWEGVNTSLYDSRSRMSDIVVDRSDNIHVVWVCSNFTYINETVGWRRTSIDIYYIKSEESRNSWFLIERLTYGCSGGILYPRAKIDDNNILHIVWFGHRDIHYDNYEIYYKRSLVPVSEPPIAVTQSLNQTTCKPGNSITVSGNAIYNDSIVPNANVSIKILETGEWWNTVTDSSGDYSKIIAAPDTPGNYTIRVTITSGNHTGWKQMRLTVEAESVTNGRVTEEEGFNIFYLVIIGAIAGGIIVAFALLRLRKPEAPKIEKPKEERKPELEFPSKIQTMTLRCPECKMTFSVEVKPKPFGVKCPNCGKEGEIK